MSELLNVVQMIVQDTMEGIKLTDLAMGTVISAAPLLIQIDAAMPPLSEKALLLTDTVKAKTVQVQGGGGGTVELSKGLAAGDKVLMLRVSKGQRYIVLSKEQEV